MINYIQQKDEFDYLINLIESLEEGNSIGILLNGPPGTGKTLLAISLANYFYASYYMIDGSPDLDRRDIEGNWELIQGDTHFNYGPLTRAIFDANENGIAFIQTIGGNTSKTRGDAWSNKYLFPSGMIPSTAQIGKAMEGIFVAEDWHNFGPDYDKTFMAWHQNFEKAWPELKKTYDERFYRIWRYYLLLCAGAFRSRYLQLWQIVMTRPGTEQPNVRIS